MRWRHNMAAGQRKILAIAIFSADPAMRRSLEQLLREDSALSIADVVDDPAAISLLIDQNHVNVVLADAPAREQLAHWRTRHNQTDSLSLLTEPTRKIASTRSMQ